MRTFASFGLLVTLLIPGGAFLGAPAHADVIDDEPVPGLDPTRRAPPMAAPPPAPEPAVVADPGLEPTPAAHADPGWRFSATAYMWLPHTTGTTTVDGLDSDLDVDFGDIFSDFDAKAAGGRFEAHRSRFGLFLDALWYDVDGSFSTDSAGLTTRPDVEGVKVDFGLLYEAFRWESGQGSLAISPLIGGRYSRIDQGIRVRNTGRIDDTNDWWEPFLGARFVWGISEPFDVTVQGDVGGFGVGSDLSWQVSGDFGFRFTDWFKLTMGYAVYDVDWSGSGGGQGFNSRMHGPRVGLQFDL